MTIQHESHASFGGEGESKGFCRCQYTVPVGYSERLAETFGYNRLLY